MCIVMTFEQEDFVEEEEWTSAFQVGGCETTCESTCQVSCQAQCQSWNEVS